MNKALRTVALLSAMAFAYAAICAGSGKEAYGYICAIWWSVMFVMFKGGEK